MSLHLGTHRTQALLAAHSSPSLPAGCGKPPLVPSGNISPSLGSPSTLGSLSSPMGASPVPRPPRSHVRSGEGSPPARCSVQTAEPGPPHSLWGRGPAQGSQPPFLLCLQAASSSFRSSDKPIRTPSRSMRECPCGHRPCPHKLPTSVRNTASWSVQKDPSLVEADAPGIGPLGPSRAGEELGTGPPRPREGLP